MIVGKKVALRPIEDKDLPLLVKWRNDPRSRTRFYSTELIALSGQKKWLENLLNDPTRIQFMITRLEDGVTIGTVGLMRIDHRNQTVRPGPFIMDPAERGAQLGVEALRTILRYAFRELNMQRAYGTVFDFNRSAAMGFEAIGFKREGVARKSVWVDGEWRDAIYMGLLRDEWDEERLDRLGGLVSG
ncbi:MAG: GNAT family N-acetyltransferase [Chloroflexi bacterium]|nr:GNAT family N-acetyltransferase [Chloroflexota bacterium]